VIYNGLPLLLVAFVNRCFSILPQNAFHFAAKCTPFCRKTHAILPQNGFYFGPKWILFWPKMDSVLAQNGTELLSLTPSTPITPLTPFMDIPLFSVHETN